MKITHVTPHLGGGVGTVIMDWVVKDKSNEHTVLCLDYANEKAKKIADEHKIDLCGSVKYGVFPMMEKADVVLVHYWKHPLIKDMLAQRIPACRLAFWCHNNTTYSEAELRYPDIWVDTSPIQAHGKFIWSTGDISRFLKIEPKSHEGFNIGYIGTVDYKKIHQDFIPMCLEIANRIPEARFTVVGECHIPSVDMPYSLCSKMKFTGRVDDVAPYLAEMDVLFYPLRPDHYGTCEQVLGEAMAAGVVPVTMGGTAERMITMEPEWPEGISCVDIIEALHRDAYSRKVLFPPRLQEQARTLYSIDKMIRQWNDVFAELMKSPKTHKPILEGI